MHSVVLGFGLGFVVALQLGPMSLFLIRSTLRQGLVYGLAIGLGIAVVDLLYSAAGAAGAAPILTIDVLHLALGILGAVVLCFLGFRSLWTAMRVHTGTEVDGDVATPARAFLTSMGATASNPLTIASWAAIFAAASTATDSSAVPLVLGVGLGSLTWTALLAVVVAAVRHSVGQRGMRIADAVAGVGMVGFGFALGWRTFADS